MIRCAGNRLFLLAVICAGGLSSPETASSADVQGDTNSSVAKIARAPDAKPPRAPVCPLQTAFSKAVAALEGRIDLYDTKGWISLRRGQTNGWMMTLRKYPGQKKESLRIRITDAGVVELLDTPPGATQISPHSNIPSPAVALLKAIHSLKNRVDFLDPDGETKFTRTRGGEWLVTLREYEGIPFQGWMLYIGNDLTVKQGSAP